jgi:UDP-2,3-diacylglucosamine hydrolase
MSLKIEDNAIFIADAHYHEIREEFLDFLDEVSKTPHLYPQIFLVGDIADILIPQIDFFLEKNQKLINKLNQLSTKTKIIYIEGNHDFNLENIFNKKIDIYPIKQQPLIAEFKNHKVAISHGDIFLRLKYRVFSKIIRCKFLLKILNFFDKNFSNFITKRVWRWLETKVLDSTHSNFRSMIDRKIDNYRTFGVNLVIEGHYHQNIKLKFDSIEYINIPSFAIKHQYLKYSNGKLFVTNFSI